MQISRGGGVHHADDGVSLAFVHDPPGVDLAAELEGIVVAVEIEDGDELLAECQTAHRVAVLVNRRGVNADAHGVGQHQHHAASH